MTIPRWLYHPCEPLPDDCDAREWLGSKGALLRSLTTAGFPVPPCFTITTEACRRYLAPGGCWPEGLERQVREAVARLESVVGRPFGRASEPLLLAVRGGAASSLPGMLLTLLNCGLTRTWAETQADDAAWGVYARWIRDLATARQVDLSEVPEGVAGEQESSCARLLQQYEARGRQAFPQDPWELLRHSITAVFDSWCGARAVAYRRAHQLADSGATAVTVQAMIPTDVAGVFFSRDPRQPAADSMIIEAVAGLGETLVSGRTEPERHIVARSGACWPSVRQRNSAMPAEPCAAAGGTGAALRASRDSQGPIEPDETAVTSVDRGGVLLGRELLSAVCALGLDIERQLGSPVDVEWGCASGNLVLLQARPLLEPRGGERLQGLRQAELARLASLAREHGTRLWVRHSLSESLSAPTPLTWDLMRRFMSGRGGLGRLYRSLGYTPSPRVCEQGCLDLVAGRIYTDPDRLAAMFGAGLPWGYDLAALRLDPRLAERGPTQLVPERADALLLFRLPAILWTVWRASRRLRHEGIRAAARFEQQMLPAYLTYLQEQQARDLLPLTDRELVTTIEGRCLRVLEEFGAELLRPGLYAGLAVDALEQHLVQFLGPDEGRRLARRLAVGGEVDPSVSPEDCLSLVAQEQLALPEFLVRCGHRGPNELELAAPRWREIPEQAARWAAWLRPAAAPSPAARRARAAAEREHAAEVLWNRMRAAGASSCYGRLEREVAVVQRWLPLRETAKHYWLMGYALIRAAVLELARRANLGTQVFFLRYDELRQFPWTAGVGPVGPAALGERQERWQGLQRLAVPDALEVAHLETIGTAEAAGPSIAARLEARVLSPGVARGPVQVVTADKPFEGRPPGYVLVCPSLEPGLTPVLLGACAVVVDRGGMLSHGAIVARQWGLPAVVVAGASRLLRDGQTLVVDADRGCLFCEGVPLS